MKFYFDSNILMGVNLTRVSNFGIRTLKLTQMTIAEHSIIKDRSPRYASQKIGSPRHPFFSKIFIYASILMFDPSKCLFYIPALIYGVKEPRYIEKLLKSRKNKFWISKNSYSDLEKDCMPWKWKKYFTPKPFSLCSLANFMKTSAFLGPF